MAGVRSDGALEPSQNGALDAQVHLRGGGGGVGGGFEHDLALMGSVLFPQDELFFGGGGVVVIFFQHTST